MKLNSAIFGAVALLLSASPAFAWGVNVEGPDVFGDTKAIATVDSGRNSLVVQCDSNDMLYLAFIIPKKKFEDIPSRPAKFLVQIDAGQPSTLDADFRSWNDDYAGFVMSGRSAELISTVLSFGTAKTKINVGYDIAGNRDSASFGARRSTKTIEKLAKACALKFPEAAD